MEKRDIQTPINKAVMQLDNSINDMAVKLENISEALYVLHPYLLNRLILGLLKTINSPMRSRDARINPKVRQLAKEIWGEAE